MNFKLLFIFFICTSCGLKKAPISPKSKLLPSLTDEYSIKQSKEDGKKKKKEK